LFGPAGAQGKVERLRLVHHQFKLILLRRLKSCFADLQGVSAGSDIGDDVFSRIVGGSRGTDSCCDVVQHDVRAGYDGSAAVVNGSVDGGCGYLRR